MRNLLAFLAAVTLTVAGLGWYLGWYKLNSSPAADGHHNVNIDVNTDKITEDIHRAEKKILEQANEHLQPAKEKTEKAPNNSAGGPASLVAPLR